MNIKLITVTSHPEHAGMLISSAKKQGWDLVVIHAEWKGFGTKIIAVRDYLLANPQIENFIFVDAHDVVVLGNEKEAISIINDNYLANGIFFSAEKACWPDPSLREAYSLKYPVSSDWAYLNSGLYYAKSSIFLSLFNRYDIEYLDDDQLWFTKVLLDRHFIMGLDKNCQLFQSYSFIAPDDFAYNDKRLYNLKTKTLPPFIHGNGKTNMDKIIELL